MERWVFVFCCITIGGCALTVVACILAGTNRRTDADEPMFKGSISHCRRVPVDRETGEVA